MGAEKSKEIPRVLSGWVMVCQEGDTAASGLSDGTRHAAAGGAGLFPHAHMGLWEQGEQTRGQGVAGGCSLHRLFHLTDGWCLGCTFIWRSAGCFCKG